MVYPTGVRRAPSWASRRLIAVVAVLLTLSITGSATGVGAAAASADRLISVIVREMPGAGSEPERAVLRAGGTIGRQIGIINGFSAVMPESRLADLERARGVVAVTPNGRVQLMGAGVDGHDVKADTGSMYAVREMTGAGEYWNDGFTGRGVDVAVIDSGAVPVEGLNRPGKVIHGPDLSFESQADNVRNLDTFGHGTHMAGIIAGRDTGDYKIDKGDEENFLGVAPGARIVSVKVADAYGSTDVSQVLAAIDWVVQHRHDNGMNIRVLNLSFGTDGTQDYTLDPLTYAVEVAWRSGIFVVVAAGNEGYGSAKLNNPAYDPLIMAVGAADGKGTYTKDDDVVASFSSTGDASRHPDLVAPGKSIVSLRDPGSYLDVAYPGGRVGKTPRFFKGSGTSQAAAVVSGAAALVIQQRPSITPDQLKGLLKRTAYKLPKAHPSAQGAGMIDLKRTRDAATPLSFTQTFAPATGLGSLELARGTHHLVHDGVTLQGEVDIFGQSFETGTWAPKALAGSTWSGGTWNGSTWSGSTWSGSTWSGSTWSGSTWSGSTWSGSTWSGSTWSGSTWSGSTWSGSTWSGSTWSGSTWSGDAWCGSDWSDGAASSSLLGVTWG